MALSKDIWVKKQELVPRLFKKHKMPLHSLPSLSSLTLSILSLSPLFTSLPLYLNKLVECSQSHGIRTQAAIYTAITTIIEYNPQVIRYKPKDLKYISLYLSIVQSSIFDDGVSVRKVSYKMLNEILTHCETMEHKDSVFSLCISLLYTETDELVTLLGKYLHIIYPKNTLEARFNQFSRILKLCCEQNQDLKISLGKIVTYVAGTGVSCILDIEDKQEQGIQLCYCLLLLVVVTPSSPSSLLPSLPLLHSYLTNDIGVSPAEQENIRNVLLDIIQKLVKKEWSSSLCSSICSSLYSIIGTCPQIKLIDKTVSTLVTIISTLNLSPKPLWTLLQAYIQPLCIPKGTKITAIVLNSQFPTKQRCVTVVGALLICNSSYSLSIPPHIISPANLYPAIYFLLLPYVSPLTSPPLYLATLKEITAGITRCLTKMAPLTK
ncbi:hypothetical protein WA158_006931 [Blastocystis sp. Blastoise]